MVAVVRGASDEKAAERLRAGFDSGDPALLQRFDALAKHLTVYSGAHLQPAVHPPSPCQGFNHIS